MRRTAFVTGGTGFLGINLIHQLLEQDWKIVALYRSEKSKDRIKDLPIEFVQGTITDIDSLRKGMPENVDAIFHLAGSTNYWKKGNQNQYDTNVTGTQNMLDVALEKKAKRFVYTSSIASFGIPKGKIDEQSVSNADTCNQYYSYTKWLSEKDVKKAFTAHGLHTVIMNPAHIVGPYDTHNWIEMFMQVHKGKVPVIPSGFGQYAHVRDIAAAHISAVDNGKPGEQYILGGEDATFLQFINAIEKVMDKPLSKKETPDILIHAAEFILRIGSVFTGKQPLLTPDLVKLLLKKVEGSSAKAEADLGFTTCSLEEQVRDTYEWLKQDGAI